MIKKRNRSEFFLRETLGYSLEQVHIELIERPHILGTLWNWSEEWKASQVQSLFVLNCTPFLFFVSRIQGYMLSLMNEVDPFIFRCMFFVWNTKLYFPCLYPTWGGAEKNRVKLTKNMLILSQFHVTLFYFPSLPFNPNGP